MTTGYTFTITCPDCGGQYNHVTGSGPSRTDVRAVLQCTQCGREAVITVTLSLAYKPDADRDKSKDAERKRLQRARDRGQVNA